MTNKDAFFYILKVNRACNFLLNQALFGSLRQGKNSNKYLSLNDYFTPRMNLKHFTPCLENDSLFSPCFENDSVFTPCFENESVFSPCFENESVFSPCFENDT